MGIAIATCCHHACQFEDYAGKEWFLAQGFTQAEFEVLKKWSGWANSVNLNLNTSATAGGAVTGDESSIALPEDNVADAGIGAGAGAVEGVNNKANVNVSAQDLTEQQQEQRNSVEVEEGNDHQAPLSAQVVRPENITPTEMQLLGWQVKRIFDHGRVEYINKYYRMSARQIRYCERHLSPECVMIVATEL